MSKGCVVEHICIFVSELIQDAYVCVWVGVR
jgi:hypothetical protein